MLPLAPHVRLLLAIAEAAEAADFLRDAGVQNMTVRHSRNRKPTRGERPCATLIFVSDDARPDDLQLNEWEMVREMVVDVQVDLELSTEDSQDDPTGLGMLSRVVAVFLTALKDPLDPIYLGGMCDWIAAGAIDPDDRSTPDEGRMTRALTVVYRTRSDDANVLLWAGENE